MLHYAKQNGLHVDCLDIHTDVINGRWDLISTCMAFHWFDQEQVINTYKTLSESKATAGFAMFILKPFQPHLEVKVTQLSFTRILI